MPSRRGGPSSTPIGGPGWTPIDTLHRDSGDGHLDYLRITLTNATISSYEMLDEYNEMDEPIRRIPERVGVAFERIRIVYVETRDDHSAGDEHEIEYDVARGV